MPGSNTLFVSPIVVLPDKCVSLMQCPGHDGMTVTIFTHMGYSQKAFDIR